MLTIQEFRRFLHKSVYSLKEFLQQTCANQSNILLSYILHKYSRLLAVLYSEAFSLLLTFTSKQQQYLLVASGGFNTVFLHVTIIL